MDKSMSAHLYIIISYLNKDAMRTIHRIGKVVCKGAESLRDTLGNVLG